MPRIDLDLGGARPAKAVCGLPVDLPRRQAKGLRGNDGISAGGALRVKSLPAKAGAAVADRGRLAIVVPRGPAGDQPSSFRTRGSSDESALYTPAPMIAPVIGART